jgi:hypothetical protein
MTLGNSPQPLTRRQLRELARESEPVPVENGAENGAGNGADVGTGMAPAGTPDVTGNATPSAHHSRHTAPSVDAPPVQQAAERGPAEPVALSPAKPAAAPLKPAATSATQRADASSAQTSDRASSGKPGADKRKSEKPGSEKSNSGKPVVPAPANPTAATTPRSAPAPLPIPGEVPAALPVADEAPASEAPASKAPALNPPASKAPAPNVVVIDSVVVDPGPALTRRELRALHAAASAGPAPIGAAAPTGQPAPAAGTEASARGTAVGEPASVGNGLNPPIGHWSVDPDDDDGHIQTIGRRDDQTFDDLVGNGVGAGGIPTTTNALILPAIPRQGASGPIASTGEIMITGSIDLPRSLGATGQHPNLFDSSEMDRMLDQLDEGGHHNDVAPVSASRAVSTHTSTRGVMTPPRKRGASLPTVLAITAAVLAIGVLSLFVVGYAFNIY